MPAAASLCPSSVGHYSSSGHVKQACPSLSRGRTLMTFERCRMGNESEEKELYNASGQAKFGAWRKHDRGLFHDVAMVRLQPLMQLLMRRPWDCWLLLGGRRVNPRTRSLAKHPFLSYWSGFQPCYNWPVGRYCFSHERSSLKAVIKRSGRGGSKRMQPTGPAFSAGWCRSHQKH